jgi:hypothetical protein
MAIYDYLPTYHQVEANNLKGLQPGFVVAQMEIAPAATGDLLSANGMFENGHICGISADGIVKATGSEKALFIHYSEPLNTLFNGAKFFAINPENECGRLVQLIPGDEWMSDMEPSAVCINGRIVELGTESAQSKDDWYGVNVLPDGTPAHHYMFIG